MEKGALRLYLDTADLIAIADGDVAREDVDGLRQAMQDVGGALVFSVNHAWDFYPRSDEPTRERIIAAVERFPLVVFAENEPHTFEGTEDDPRDLALRSINIRELMVDPSATEALGVLDPVTSKVHEAEQQSLVAARATRDTPPKKAVIDRYMQGLIGLVERQDGHAADTLLAFFEQHNGPVESDEERAAILSQLQPVATAFETLRSVPGLDVHELMSRIRESEDSSLGLTRPGVYFQSALRAARKRNVDRNSKRSDLVDLHHVQYLPYVDIFTTDKENVAALAPLLTKASLRRSAALLRNRNLARVTEELVRLGGTG